MCAMLLVRAINVAPIPVPQSPTTVPACFL